MTMMKMSKKKSSNGNDDDVGRPRPTHRAWKLLRLALLWARKGGVFRRRLMMELRVVPKLLKSSLAHMLMQHQLQQQYYFERQLSFDKTPIFPTLRTKTSCFRSSMRFINIPCLNPPLVLDYFDDDQVDMIINNHEDQSDSEDHRYCCYDDEEEGDSTARQSFLIKCDEDDDGRDIIQDDEEEKVPLSPASASNNKNMYEEEELEESVDIRADEFIAKFYQQMKLQRQISYLPYTQNLTC